MERKQNTQGINVIIALLFLVWILSGILKGIMAFFNWMAMFFVLLTIAHFLIKYKEVIKSGN